MECRPLFRDTNHPSLWLRRLSERRAAIESLSCLRTIGWIAFQDLSIKQRLVDVQYFGCACPSRASELQAIMVLRASDRILARNMAIIRRNIALLDAFMAAPGFYSARSFTPGLVEFGEPIVWIVMGIFFYSKAMMGASIDKLKISPPVTPMGDDAQSLVSASSK